MNHISLFLKDIHLGQKSGQLIFNHENIKKILFFRTASLIHARTNRLDERLGEILLKKGKISREIYESLDTFILPKQNIGEVLLEKGLITDEVLYQGLVDQFKEIVFNTFSVFDARISFQEKEDLKDKIYESNLSIPAHILIQEGIRRMPFHPYLVEFLGERIFSQKGKTYFYQLTEEEKNIFRYIDGASPPDILLRSGRFPPDLFWKTLYLFYCLDLIDVKGEKISWQEAKKEPLSQERLSKIQEVIALRDKLHLMNYYQLLGIRRGASEEEFKRAYFQLVRKFHPDSFGTEVPQDEKKIIEEVFDQITKAYQTLSNSDRRKAYDAKIFIVSPEEEKDAVKRADIKFRQGKTLYSQGRYEEAIAFLQEAVRLKKNKGDYYLLLALAETKVPAYTKKAEDDFQKAIELEPWNTEGYVGLGLLYKQEGLPVKASLQFKKALEVDPDHEIARKELDALAPKEKKKGLAGLLSLDLFGKKKK